MPNPLAYTCTTHVPIQSWTSCGQFLSLVVYIECTETPVEYRCPAQTISKHEHPIMKQDIDNLIQKRVITTARYDPKQISSSIFLRPKKDGSYRIILNLKKYNELVTYRHFKWVHYAQQPN